MKLNIILSLCFAGTQFCESILLPTEHTLKVSLEATFIQTKRGMHSDGKDHIDLCCRSFHKCDAHKHIELKYTTESYIRHCDCIDLFQGCLKGLNTSLSNETATIYSLNATKCYAKDYPIVKCIKYGTYLESEAQLFKVMNSTERGPFFNRCIKYDLDHSKPQRIQIFDAPFDKHLISIDSGK